MKTSHLGTAVMGSSGLFRFLPSHDIVHVVSNNISGVATA